MNIQAYAFLTNELNQVLLWAGADKQKPAWQLPGGVIPPGQLPAEGLADLVAEQVGLRLLPVRLVGVYGVGRDVALLFRCLQKGGMLSAESGAYFKQGELPRPCLLPHPHFIQQAASHAGGYAVWGMAQELTLWQKLWGSEPQAEATWQVSSVAAWLTADGELLTLAQAEGQGVPTAVLNPVQQEMPWHTAARLGQQSGLLIPPQELRLIYVLPEKKELRLGYTAVLPPYQPIPNHLTPIPLQQNQPPATLTPFTQQFISDLQQASNETIFLLR
jgi:ADP-ribose pyrophosphatase YjhB (NUDIX family)